MNTVEIFLTSQEESEVVKAIRMAETNTSGEIRVHIEEATYKNIISRAEEIFNMLNMQNTIARNGVLIYIATDKKQFAIIGDEGIDIKVSADFWEFERNLIAHYIRIGKNAKALIDAIYFIGEKLKDDFPYIQNDTNELSDEISKGQ